jgi:hypothetical protein
MTPFEDLKHSAMLILKNNFWKWKGSKKIYKQNVVGPPISSSVPMKSVEK